MPFQKHVLPNGLEIIGEPSPSARSVALGFFVRTGSRDEGPGVSGVTHFLEHMVFKGTPRRTALDVNKDFDRIGANYNAYTSEESTVFYAAVLPEYLPKAVDVLADILRPSLRVEDFETEKEVIIEEIGMYEDQPMWSAYDHAKQVYFGTHPLGNSILGTPESIRALQRDQMYEYFARRYVPTNIAVAAAGRFDWQDLVGLVERHCGQWEAGSAPRSGVTDTTGSGDFRVQAKPTVHQEHLVLISPGPAIDSPLTYAANILAMILGDDSGSRIYWALVDPGLVESADANYHEYDGTGAFFTMLSCDADGAQENLDVCYGLLRQLQAEGVTEEEVRQAKNKVMARIVRSAERPMGRMQAIGGLWSYLKTYRSLDEELAKFDAVTVGQVGEVLERYPLDRVTTYALGPLGELRRPS